MSANRLHGCHDSTRQHFWFIVWVYFFSKFHPHVVAILKHTTEAAKSSLELQRSWFCSHMAEYLLFTLQCLTHSVFCLRQWTGLNCFGKMPCEKRDPGVEVQDRRVPSIKSIEHLSHGTAGHYLCLQVIFVSPKTVGDNFIMSFWHD